MRRPFSKVCSSTMARLYTRAPQISEHGSHGLAFKHTADHKLIVVDPLYNLDNEQLQRTEVRDAAYLQVVIFDHHTQFKHAAQSTAFARHASLP